MLETLTVIVYMTMFIIGCFTTGYWIVKKLTLLYAAHLTKKFNESGHFNG